MTEQVTEQVIEPHLLKFKDRGGTVELSLVIPHDLMYFRGHFPTLPILPGVVQIAWAMNYSRRHFDLGESCAKTLRIKFRRLIRPGDRLVLTLVHRTAHSEIEFSYTDQQGTLSSGRIGLAAA